MNREQRRIAAKEEKKLKKLLWPSSYFDVPNHCGLNDGDYFTIQGLHRLENGHILTNCKEGEETKFIARRII